MTTVREIVETPGMPGWVRFGLTLVAVALLRFAAEMAAPMVHGGWAWGHGIATLVALAVALDLLHSAARKRWPLVLFVDLLLGRLVAGRWR